MSHMIAIPIERQIVQNFKDWGLTIQIESQQPSTRDRLIQNVALACWFPHCPNTQKSH